MRDHREHFVAHAHGALRLRPRRALGVEQPRALDGDADVACDQFQQPQIVGSEGIGPLRADSHRADHAVADEHRRARH